MSHSNTPADLGESEPPHIKNWFSSYEYESFVLETNDNFGFSEHQGSQGFENDQCSIGNTLKLTENPRELVTNEENEGVLIKCNQPEEENKCQKQVLESQDSPLLSSEPPGIENWFSSYVYESPAVDTIDDLIASDLKESIVGCNKKVEYEKDGNLCATPDDLVYKQPSEYNNSPTKDDKTPTDLPNNGANMKSFETGSRKLEEPGSGFVSTKSKKEDHQKTKWVKGMGRNRCVDSPVNKMKKSDERVSRVTLGDVTNILDGHSSVTGKWKCPRKRKPDLGPPLKQLRLGQWFHHE